MREAGAKIIATGRRKRGAGRAGEGNAAERSPKRSPAISNDARFVDDLAKRARDVDILVNNAGILKYAPLMDMTDGDVEAMFRTNVLAAFRVTHAVAKSMMERRRGHIIVMTSIAAREVYPLGVIYCATKHALSAIARGLRVELQGHGIKVTEIAPGMVDTDIRATQRPSSRAGGAEGQEIRSADAGRGGGGGRVRGGRAPRTAVRISSSCDRKAPPNRKRITEEPAMAKTMAKTMAKLQPRAKKTSPKKAAPPASRARRPKPVEGTSRSRAFNVNHFRAEDFRTDGLRSYAQYRDLGMSKATNGLLQAHVIRLDSAVRPGGGLEAALSRRATCR